MGLDTVELIMEMEETFGIKIDDRDAEQIGTVGQAYRYILGKLEHGPAAPCGKPGVATAWHPEEVWTVLRDLIAVQLGVPKELVTEEKHFVHDFGAD